MAATRADFLRLAPTEVAYLIDFPYGVEHGHLYDGLWNKEKMNRLIDRTDNVIVRGYKAIVWCGIDDIAIWQKECGGLMWNFRKANTHMKSASKSGSGAKASGGWIGITA